MIADLDREGRVLPFRRRPYAAKRRKRSLWAIALTGLLGAAAIVGVPLTLVGWLLSSPRFALQVVDFDAVSGVGAAGSAAGRVPSSWVQQALAPFVGRNLLLLPLDEVRAALVSHPWAAAIEVSKQLPDRLRVRVVERSPAAVLRDGANYWYLDADGHRIGPYDPTRESVDLLLVSSSAAGEIDLGQALALEHELAAAQPAWAAKLSEVEALGDEDFCVYTAALPFPLKVKAGTLLARTASLQTLLPEIVRRYPRVEAVDLRFARRIVIQPAARPDTPTGRAQGEPPAGPAPVPARTLAGARAA